MGASLYQLRLNTFVNLNDVSNVLAATAERYRVDFANIVINNALQHYVKILNANYQGYLSRDYSLDLLANVREYTLDSTFRTPVYEVRRTINQVNFFLDEFASYNQIVSTVPVPNEEWIPTWHLEDQRIVFNMFPAANEIAGVIIKHQKKVTPLVTDTDEIGDDLYELEDCVVLKSTIRLLRAKDVSGALKGISSWETELKEAEAALWMQAGKRHVKPDRPIPIAIEDNFYI